MYPNIFNILIMENVLLNHLSLGEIVTNDIRAAAIFTDAGIDFCCGGKKTLEQACAEKNIDTLTLSNKINALSLEPIQPGQNFNDWSLSFLCDYIVNTHHKYVLKALPELFFYTQKIAQVHGANHSELNEVAYLFEKIKADLIEHMRKEEEIVFPAIREQESSKTLKNQELLKNEIGIMNEEHEFAGESMDRIRELTNDYKIPLDACNTYMVTLKSLKKFEDDLHIHVHLENNILFPKALKM